MALISNNFKNDSISTTIDVKPIIVLATQNLENNQYDILDIYSTDNVVLEDNYGNKHQALEILDKISSIKNSVDYESRKLKINTFRFTIKNYYDIKNTLTNTEKYKLKDTGESPLNTLIGSYVILYYKTQSTNVINIDLNPELGDNNCSIMFTGIINRLDQDSKSIKIQAEDYVQTYISDVSVPSLKGSDIPETGSLTELEQDDVLPMTYGIADRVPVKYIGGVQFADNYEVDSLIRTTKALYSSELKNWKFYEGDEGWVAQDSWLEELPSYVGYRHKYISLIGYKNSDEVQFLEDSRIIDLDEVETDGDVGGLVVNLPVSCAGNNNENNNTSDNFFNSTGDYIEDWLIQNQSLAFNRGWDFKWYREGDIEISENHPDFDNYWANYAFDGQLYYSNDTGTSHRVGRWKIFYLPKKVNIYEFYAKFSIGVTLYTDVGASVYIKPVVGSQWSEIIEVNYTDNAYSLYDILHDNRNDDIHSGSGSWEQVGAMCLTRKADATLWENYSITKKMGKFYTGNEETNKVVFFEYFNDGSENEFEWDIGLWGGSNIVVNENSGAGVYMNFSYYGNTYPTYFLSWETAGSDKRYAAIKGRKSYASTEDLSFMIDEYHWAETLGITPDTVTLPQIINGVDFVIPDNFDSWLDATEQVELSVIEGFSDDWTTSAGYSVTIESLYFLTPSSYNYLIYFPDLGQNEYFDSVIAETNVFNLDDNKLLRLNSFWNNIYKVLGKKLMENVFEYEIRKYLDEKYAEGVTLYVSTNEDDITLPDTHPNQGIYNPDVYFHNEESIGYYSFRGLLQDLSINIALCENPDYWASDLIDESSSYFEDIWINQYADVRKCLKRRLLKIMYQSDLNPDPVDDLFNFQNDWLPVNQNGEPLDDPSIGDDIYWFLWYLDNFYLDDTIKTINEGIFNHLGYDSDTGERLHLYQFTNQNTFSEEEIRQYGAWYDYQYQTNGVIDKPVDIIIDILRREMSYGTNEGNLLDLNFYDDQSIYKSRDVYANWKMGFCVDKDIDGKKLIEDILSETMSYFTFTPQGKFSLVTLKERYTIDDVNHFIDEGDVIKYKFSKTKKEDLVLQSKFFYRYDNGLNNYPFETDVLKIENLLPDYDGYNYYNLDEVTGYKERKLRYHSDRDTVATYHRNYLLNNCNQHLKVKIDLPLNYANVQLSDIIHLPLINNDPVFGLDYSRVQILNGQPIYPAFIVTSLDIKLDKVSLEAYQLHYLDIDGLHGFHFEDEESTIVANLNQYNSLFPEIRNWNYLPEENRVEGYTYIQGIEIPYGDVNGEGNINIVDVVNIVNHILGISVLSSGDAERISHYNFISNTINATPDPINVVKLTQLIDIVLE